MKYFIICAAVLLACIAVAGAVTYFIYKNKDTGKPVRIMTAALLSCALFVIAAFGYLSVYSHADETALSYLQSKDEVAVTKIKGGYFFDGPGEDNALVFYPGAKVEAEAYAPLLFQAASLGADCFLAEMPLRMAVMDVNAADRFLSSYDYENWYIGGHSLGGTAASIYTSKHDGIKGLVLLASYPSKKQDDSIRMISIYGSEDGCLDMDAYEENKNLWPKNSSEVIIPGGNHAQFGSYGLQEGDGESLIPADLQQLACRMNDQSLFCRMTSKASTAHAPAALRALRKSLA